MLTVVALGCQRASGQAHITAEVERLGGKVAVFKEAEIRERRLPASLKRKIGAIYLDYTDLTSVDFHTIIPFETLEIASFQGTGVDNGQATELQNCKRLRFLMLQSSSVTDECLSSIAQVQTLEALHLDRCQITDAGLAHLHECRSLRKLTLWDTLVTKEGVERLQNACPDVRIRWSKVKSADVLAALAQLEQLGATVTSSTEDSGASYSVTIGSFWKGGDGLAMRKSLSELRRTGHLRINLHRHSAEIVDALSALSEVGKLTVIDDGKWNDDDIARIVDDRELGELVLISSSLTESVLAQLERARGLKRLTLQGMRLTDVGVRHLAKVKTLESLILHGPQITDAALRQLDVIAGLKRLELRECPDASKPALNALVKRGIEVVVGGSANDERK